MKYLFMAITQIILIQVHAQVPEETSGYEIVQFLQDTQEVAFVLNHLNSTYTDSKLQKIISTGPHSFYVEVLTIKNTILKCSAHHFILSSSGKTIAEQETMKCGSIK